jgi:hypothetical protein
MKVCQIGEIALRGDHQLLQQNTWNLNKIETYRRMFPLKAIVALNYSKAISSLGNQVEVLPLFGGEPTRCPEVSNVLVSAVTWLVNPII